MCIHILLHSMMTKVPLIICIHDWTDTVTIAFRETNNTKLLTGIAVKHETRSWSSGGGVRTKKRTRVDVVRKGDLVFLLKKAREQTIEITIPSRIPNKAFCLPSAKVVPSVLKAPQTLSPYKVYRGIFTLPDSWTFYLSFRSELQHDNYEKFAPFSFKM